MRDKVQRELNEVQRMLSESQVKVGKLEQSLDLERGKMLRLEGGLIVLEKLLAQVEVDVSNLERVMPENATIAGVEVKG